MSTSAMAKELEESNCYVALTHDYLDAASMMDRVRSPKAGAIVLFAGKIPEPSQIISLTYSRYYS
jgi:molybdopterin synthase catalytic subunit